MNPGLGFRRIDHASWTVAELDPVITFYCEVFGAQLLYRMGPIDVADIPRDEQGRDWSTLHLDVPDARFSLAMLAFPDGFKLELFHYERPQGESNIALPSNQVGSHHLGIQVDDLEQAASFLSERGCQVFEKIEMQEGPTVGSRFRYLKDPWQNILELCETTPNPTMTPEPLAMTRRAINPDTLYPSTGLGFSHAIEQAPGRTLHLSGQVAWDAKGELVGAGDVLAQTRQALANLKQVLNASGATPADVVRIRTYVVNHSPALLADICGLIGAFYEGAEPAANTFIGVQALALPEFLIEIEATASLA